MEQVCRKPVGYVLKGGPWGRNQLKRILEGEKLSKQLVTARLCKAMQTLWLSRAGGSLTAIGKDEKQGRGGF